MSTALQTKHEASLPAFRMEEAELLSVLKSSLYPGASDASVKLVISYCKASNLDPMQKPVHIVPMWDAKSGSMRDVIMPGIGLYRTQAARTGCAGVSEPEYGPDVTGFIGGAEITHPAWCRVTVKRRQSNGAVDEFTAKEFWVENYAVRGSKERSIAPNAMWTKRPYGQIAKCAEAQALRKAFPEIGSEPTADEMAGKTLNEFDVTVDAATGEITQKAPAQAPRQELPTCPEKNFTAQINKWTPAIESGNKTPAEFLQAIKTKYTLTPEQEKQIKAIKPANDGVTDAVVKGESTESAAEQEAVDDFVRDMG